MVGLHFYGVVFQDNLMFNGGLKCLYCSRSRYFNV